jgi:hypothetical protein
MDSGLVEAEPDIYIMRPQGFKRDVILITTGYQVVFATS